MQPVQMFIILFCSAFTGWFVSWLSLQLLFAGFSKKKINSTDLRERLAKKAGKVFQQEFESSDVIEQKIADPLLFEKLKPGIEKHVDFFLNEKLATVFPLLYKFMGEKTLGQFRHAFMIEIDLLFPVIIKDYVATLKADIKLEELISAKINAIPASAIRSAFFENARREIFFFRLSCLLAGLFMGSITILVLHFIH